MIYTFKNSILKYTWYTLKKIIGTPLYVSIIGSYNYVYIIILLCRICGTKNFKLIG